MNIAFIVYMVGIGGAERVSVTLAEHFREKGHRVSILCYRDDGTYPVHKSIPVIKLPDAANPVVRHLKRIHFFVKYARKNQIDLVIALFRGFDFTWIYRGISKSRLILSQRNDPKAEYDKNLSAKMQCLLFFSGADAVVFQTKEERDYFSRRIRKKGVLIPNPVKEFLPPPYRGPRNKVIVNFCRLDPQKNLKLLLSAFGRICQEFPEYHLKIYGEGPQKEELLDFLREKKLEGRAEICPFSDNIHEEIKDAAMFVSSSNYEGISNSMMEAMAMELPCICTDCPAGGAGMVIRNGVNGLLVPVGNEAALAAAMKKLLSEPDYALRLGREAGKVRDTFSADRICKRWDKLIKELTDTGKKGRKRVMSRN